MVWAVIVAYSVVSWTQCSARCAQLQQQLLFYVCVIGTVPSGLCSLPLQFLSVEGNVQLRCYDPCLAHLSLSAYLPSCPTESDIALCSLVAATTISSVDSSWTCDALGKPVLPPCSINGGSSWNGIACFDGQISMINLSLLPISGMTICTHYRDTTD